MNNMGIIAKEAVASGFFTEEEVVNLIEEGEDIPFHTYAVWKKMFGMVPKAGTHGWETRLWRRKNKKDDIEEKETSDDDKKRDFYLTKSFLFHISQVEKIKEDKAENYI